MDDQTIKTIIAILIFVPIVVIYMCTVGWAYHDAVRRGKPGLSVALLVALLSWPIGLLLWLVFRPNESED
jgi:hypothetical protein